MTVRPVELLYFDGCPNHEALESRLRDLVHRHAPRAELHMRRVESDDDARRMRFLGSPSVRVDGLDIEPGARERPDYGLKCRLYRGEAGLAGLPDDAWILAALDGADRAAAVLARVGLDTSRATRAAALPAADRRFYRQVLEAFATGEPPSAARLTTWADALGLDAAVTLPTLRSADLLQLDDAGAVAVAYPFSARPTPHGVMLDDGPEVWAMCAIDALGIPHMLRRAALIRADEPLGDATIEVRVDPARDAVTANPASAVVVAASSGHGPSADCRCPFINLFTCVERAGQYLESHAELTGEILSLWQAVEVGRLHFRGLLEPERASAAREG